eukprot:2224053-Pyramimonas_sp.AAC.1
MAPPWLPGPPAASPASWASRRRRSPPSGRRGPRSHGQAAHAAARRSRRLEVRHDHAGQALEIGLGDRGGRRALPRGALLGHVSIDQ